MNQGLNERISARKLDALTTTRLMVLFKPNSLRISDPVVCKKIIDRNQQDLLFWKKDNYNTYSTVKEV